MQEKDIEETFQKIIEADKDQSFGIAAIRTLLVVLERTNCEFSSVS